MIHAIIISMIVIIKVILIFASSDSINKVIGLTLIEFLNARYISKVLDDSIVTL